MSGTDQTINDAIVKLRNDISQLEVQLADKKRAVNMLCDIAGVAQQYSLETPATTPMELRADSYYGKSAHVAAKEYLEMRGVRKEGPATVREIFDSLKAGGFDLAEYASEDSAINSLRSAITKASHTFHKLPNGSIGLLEWYPAIKEGKSKKKRKGSPDVAGADVDTGDGNEPENCAPDDNED